MKRTQEDRRVQRTRQALRRALVDLIVEKGYERVTVQELADRANVGRTTFYAHYCDKNELLEKSVERLLDALQEQVGPAHSEGGRLLPVLPLFRHVEENDRLVRAFGSVELLQSTFQRQLAAVVEQRLESIEEKRPLVEWPHPVVAQYVAGALMALVWWWLRNRKPHTAEEMAAMFEQLVEASLFGPSMTDKARS